MEINAGLIITTFVFLTLYMVSHHVASILINRSRDAAEVEKKRFDTEAFDKLGDKLVATMSAMHGGVAGDAVRRAMNPTIDPEGRQENGRTGVPYQRDNGYRPDGSFSRPTAAAEASH
jgi:hypothetical protein